MVVEHQPIPFAEWFGPALWAFLQTAAILAVAALIVSFLVMAFRYGPLVAGDIIFRATKVGLTELVQMSPRRIWALARLAIQESLRRRVLVAFAVFILILLFTGWFLDTRSNDPAKLYLSFVLNTTTGLVLVMTLLVSSFSLPADIKSHTIYTVVTKPVRPGEILLGRILGFTLIGTVMLTVMGLLSYVFVIRALSHTHEVELAKLTSGADGSQIGPTSLAQNHRHEVTIDKDGAGSTDMVQGHWHEVTTRERGGKTVYELSGPQGTFSARVPLYGKLRFKDRQGKPSEKGISVGNEWGYRSYIEGGTNAAAVWTFHDVSPERFPDGLPLEMIVRVFRTHKGDIERGIGAVLRFRNPKTGRESREDIFSAKDNQIDERFYSRHLVDPKNQPLDLFDDLTDEGDLEISLQCLDSAQYFGLAQADMYLRAHDASFAANFAKCLFGGWLKLVLVTSLGVMFSTFLSGPVAALATVGAIVLGFYHEFINGLATGTTKGGGPIEALIRLFNQQNVMVEMEEGLTTTIVKTVDGWLLAVLQRLAALVPNVSDLNKNKADLISHVAHGFDIPADTMLTQSCAALGYLAAVFVIGYFFLKTREMAK